MAAAFCCFLSVLLYNCMFNTSLSHIRFSCLYVSYSLPEIAYFEYKHARLLKKCLKLNK